ncbi:MAG: glycosyltransferase family 2 protein [Lachnospiraceae bacterium]|nr:glycosyltransferase family 2 protein [Lachnospiraceae bacterium]
MKLLTIAVPSYNSEAYLERCIESLLPGGEQVEILIVNDGSKDRTEEIGKAYEAKYPGIVRVISKENGGHGSAVNTGLAHATGLYFKVVDSDDKVEINAYRKVLKTLERFSKREEPVDLLLTNYVYDKQGVRRKKVMNYHGALKKNTVLTWDDRIRMNHFQYVLMHSVTYRTEILRQSKLQLPEHTFYVDNIFLIQPMPYVKTVYYLDVNFYLYYIGRSDQSVNESVMIKRIDQQIRVNKILLDIQADYESRGMLAKRNLDRFIFQYLDMMMCVTSIMLIIAGDKESLAKKKEIWDYAKKVNPGYYKRLRYHVFGITMNLPGKGGRWLSVHGYKLMNKIFGFN